MKRKLTVCLISVFIAGAIMFAFEQFIANLLGGAGYVLGFPFPYYAERLFPYEVIVDQPLIRVANLFILFIPTYFIVNAFFPKRSRN